MFGVGVLTRGGGGGGISEIASTGGEKNQNPRSVPKTQTS